MGEPTGVPGTRAVTVLVPKEKGGMTSGEVSPRWLEPPKHLGNTLT